VEREDGGEAGRGVGRTPLMSDAAPPVECTRLNPTLRVRDVARAIDFYTSKLGFKLGFEWGEPLRFAGMNFGEVQVFLQLGDPGTVPAQVYFVVDDADALHEFQEAQGVQVLRSHAERQDQRRDSAVPCMGDHGARDRLLLDHRACHWSGGRHLGGGTRTRHDVRDG